MMHHAGARNGRLITALAPQITPKPTQTRSFRSSARALVVKPFLLSDIGEGIAEVQIIQWFVQPGARVEQFDKICEVQSDKASVEITSRFDGVIKKLHYEADDMAKVGKPLLDIDIQSELSPEDEAVTTAPTEQAGEESSARQSLKSAQGSSPTSNGAQREHVSHASTLERGPRGRSATLATPAVRHLVKEHAIDIADIDGTGKDGRVLKEDIQKFLALRDAPSSISGPSSASISNIPQDKTISLSPTQSAMFKTMTRSLSIPHFLYSDSLDVTPVNKLRRALNAGQRSPDERLTFLPFLVKAISIALTQYPTLNSRIDTDTDPSKPHLLLRGAHNIGIAVDTAQGLVVPVIRNVQSLSIAAVGSEARRLGTLARTGKLSAADMTGGSFTVSNIGSVGGGVVAPVIVEGQVAIVGVGKSKIVPAFDADGNLVKREECVLSWSADHRVCDGATVARCADVVRGLLEEPGRMLVAMS